MTPAGRPPAGQAEAGTAGAALLFSSFEPSGDALAGETIAALRRADPRLRIYALGGPRMEAAGAELLEQTTHRSSMFLATAAQAWSHHRRLGRLRRWLSEHEIAALVPVDSPAGNWSICRAVRRVQPRARIVHLVAPQLWAWAPWRVRRLRRLTDRVLCLLPFEQSWLSQRGVPATFVGHPAFDAGVAAASPPPAQLPAGRPRLAVLPVARTGEILRNWPTMLDAFLGLARRHPGLCGVVAALDSRGEAMVRDVAGRHRPEGWPAGLTLITGRTESVLDWCDLALVASGTATLQVTARNRPMVVMYNMGRLTVFVARWLVRTRTFALPNLVGEWAGLGQVVPELVPHFGAVEPVVEALDRVLDGDGHAQRQREALREVAARFAVRRFAEAAPREILAAISSRPPA